MPSPIGHALAGIAAGCLVRGGTHLESGGRGTAEGRGAPWWRTPYVRGYALLGVLPDVDFLFGSHSTYTHSIGALLVVGLLTLLIAPAWGRRGAVAAALAYGSHVLLDWLGSDDTPPLGVMALWPVDGEFYLSDLRLFPSVCRQVSELSCWMQNLQGAAWEVVTLAPLAAVSVYVMLRAPTR